MRFLSSKRRGYLGCFFILPTKGRLALHEGVGVSQQHPRAAVVHQRPREARGPRLLFLVHAVPDPDAHTAEKRARFGARLQGFGHGLGRLLEDQNPHLEQGQRGHGDRATNMPPSVISCHSTKER